MPSRLPKFVTVSIVCSVVLTAGLTATASVISRAWVCTLVWQACLVQAVIHTPDNPMHEGSPIDLVAFAFGVFLGVPIYSAVSYAGLRLYTTRRLDRKIP
jgi:hypothetical protein